MSELIAYTVKLYLFEILDHLGQTLVFLLGFEHSMDKLCKIF